MVKQTHPKQTPWKLWQCPRRVRSQQCTFWQTFFSTQLSVIWEKNVCIDSPYCGQPRQPFESRFVGKCLGLVDALLVETIGFHLLTNLCKQQFMQSNVLGALRKSYGAPWTLIFLLKKGSLTSSETILWKYRPNRCCLSSRYSMKAVWPHPGNVIV